MKTDITIFIAGIRTPLWYNIYESLKLACKKYRFKLLFCSPFNLPSELLGISNISLVQDYGHVTRANQKGLLNIDTELFLLTVDDGIFQEDSIDIALDYWFSNCKELDLICMRYAEAGDHMPIDYWRMWHHPPLRLPGISPNQLFGHHPLMKIKTLYDLGGFDCQFEYMTHALLDFNIRLVKNGGTIHLSPAECAVCNHYPADTGDHKPIFEAQCIHDQPIFESIYSQLTNNRIIINYDNWKNSEPVWNRRFGDRIPKTYEELCSLKGYKI